MIRSDNDIVTVVQLTRCDSNECHTETANKPLNTTGQSVQVWCLSITQVILIEIRDVRVCIIVHESMCPWWSLIQALAQSTHVWIINSFDALPGR